MIPAAAERSVRDLFAAPEQKRDAPERGQTHEGVDDTADGGGLTAKEPGDDVKTEEMLPQLMPPMMASTRAIRSIIMPCGLLFVFSQPILPGAGANYALDKTSRAPTAFALAFLPRLRYSLSTAYPTAGCLQDGRRAVTRLISLSHNPVFGGP